MSDRLQRLLNKSSLSESVGCRADDVEIPTTIDVSGPDMNEGRYSLRGASMIQLDKIIPDPDQPRREFDVNKMAELATSLKKHGLLQPIRLRWEQGRGVWIIIAGERRYRAAKKLKWPEIAAVCVESGISNGDIRAQQLIENLIRADLKPCETARAYEQLMEQEGWSGAEVARQLGVPRSSISESLSLLKLPKELQAEVDSGTLPVRDAYRRARDTKQQDDPAKKTTVRANKKRKRGIEKVYRTPSGAKIVVTHPRKVTDAEIHAALIEAANLVESERKAA